MKVTQIKGKPYIEVNERIKEFRKRFEENRGQILTELVSIENGVCVFKAEVYLDNKIVATGHAYEKEGSSYINKTSYIENCETSAIGRALGIFGIGIDTSIASADEVINAISNQNTVVQSSPSQSDLAYKLDVALTEKDLTDNEKIQIVRFYCKSKQIPLVELHELPVDHIQNFINKIEDVFEAFLSAQG